MLRKIKLANSIFDKKKPVERERESKYQENDIKSMESVEVTIQIYFVVSKNDSLKTTLSAHENEILSKKNLLFITCMKVYITPSFFFLLCRKWCRLASMRERKEMKFLLITEIIEYVLLHTYDDDVIKYDRGRIFF